MFNIAYVTILLCSWISVIHCNPECTPLNFKLDDLKKGQWLLENDGSFKLHFEHCHLRIFTAHAAKKCLRNNHLLFMGDSLTRYSYISLASFLATGDWSPKYTHSTHPDYPASILWEKDFPNWGEYYRVSNSMINDYKTSSYEFCDCFRDDSVPWTPLEKCAPHKYNFCSQEESMLENRYFRAYFNDHRSHSPEKRSSAAHDLLDQHVKHDHHDHMDRMNRTHSSDMLRVSYIQFNGPMPLRGRSAISSGLPLGQYEYLKFVESALTPTCPLSMLPSNNSDVIADYAEKYKYPQPRHDMHIVSAALPMTGECGWELVGLRDTDGITKLNFPNFYEDDSAGDFDRKIVQGMNVTHLLVNLGWHAGIRKIYTDRAFAKEWVKRRYRFMEKFTSFTSQAEMKPRVHPLALPHFTWRGTTAKSPFGKDNDELVQEVVAEEPGIGYIDHRLITLKLREIHNWAQSFGGKVDLTAYLKRKRIETQMNDTSSKHSEKIPNQGELSAIEEFDKLKLLLDPKLEDAVIAREQLSGDDVTLTIPAIYLDHVHFQPWVYNELNNAFLNSICPTKHS